MRRFVVACLCCGMLSLLGDVSSGFAQTSGTGQVEFTNSVWGKAGLGGGTFTFGGVTQEASLGFSIHCSLASHACLGAFYVAPIALSGHGNALTIQVAGTIDGSAGVYTITLTAPAEVAGCTLTNSGTHASGGATPTQTVQVECTGNGTTTLDGTGTATAIVNATG
jgi:hypothetical protein